MQTGFKTVNGYKWPEKDTDCAAVTFNNVIDLEQALRHTVGRRVAVQAGGNTGVWPNFLSRHFDLVYTFEPEPDNFHCLVSNREGRNIIAMQAALGNKKGGIAVGFPEGEKNYGACNIAGTGDIPLIRFDDLAVGAVDLVQLDVEGFEVEAILGMWRTILTYHPVLMIEDKGLTVPYGYPEGWPNQMLPGHYKFVQRVNRDSIFVWRD